ncbi:MAG: hypothetical protein IT318_13570 [Anaerolineales bacterium]|nr:hypothetical protein [Anaerolineales bacterium]
MPRGRRAGPKQVELGLFGLVSWQPGISDVYIEAQTTIRGLFALPDPLERNVEYALLVAAEGYQPQGYAGMAITGDLEEPVVIDIELAE